MSLRYNEYKKQKRKRRLWKIGFFLIFILFIFGLASFLSYRAKFRIKTVLLSGSILVEQSELSNETLAFLSGSYFWFFSKDNFLIYPKDSLGKYLKEKFKRIDEINLKVQNPQTLLVTIKERKPEFLWCDDSSYSALKIKEDIQTYVSTSTELASSSTSLSTSTEKKSETISKESCYFMDDYGTIFAPSPDFSGDVYFKYYDLVPTSTKENWPVGESYISSTTEFLDLSHFILRLKNLSLSPQFLHSKEDGQFEVTILGGARILFDNKTPFDKQADNLAALLNSNSFILIPDIGKEIDYIDLRFGNKVYYKMRIRSSE